MNELNEKNLKLIHNYILDFAYVHMHIIMQICIAIQNSFKCSTFVLKTSCGTYKSIDDLSHSLSVPQYHIYYRN